MTRCSLAVILLMLVGFVAIGCDDQAAGPLSVPSSTSTLPADWEGRPDYRVCVQAGAGVTRPNDELVAALRPPFASAAATNRVGTISVEPGCPAEFPQPKRADVPSPFTIHLWVRAAGDQPRAEIGENWAPPGSGNFGPVTFQWDLPESWLTRPGELEAWMTTVLGPEPTRLALAGR